MSRIVRVLFALLFLVVVSCHKSSNNKAGNATKTIPPYDIHMSSNDTVWQQIFFSPNFPDSPVHNAKWDFGDGTSSSELNCSHIYSLSGTYTVTVTIDGDSASTKQKTFFVYPDYSFSFSGVPLPGDTIRLQLNHKQLTGLSYHWDFGDGFISTDSMPYHIYALSDEFNIILTVNSDSAHMRIKAIRILNDPGHTSGICGTRLWHGNETTQLRGKTKYFTLGDSLITITYRNPIAITLLGAYLQYNPDSTSGSRIYFGDGGLNVTYDYISGQDNISMLYEHQVGGGGIGMGYPAIETDGYYWYSP